MGKIISLIEREKKYCFNKILNLINILDDYDVKVSLSHEDILLILNSLYDLYLDKGIAYQYLEDMLLYFNEICSEIASLGSVFSFENVYNGFLGCYELMVPVGIENQEFDEVFQKVKTKIDSRRFINEK